MFGPIEETHKRAHLYAPQAPPPPSSKPTGYYTFDIDVSVRKLCYQAIIGIPRVGNSIVDTMTATRSDGSRVSIKSLQLTNAVSTQMASTGSERVLCHYTAGEQYPSEAAALFALFGGAYDAYMKVNGNTLAIELIEYMSPSIPQTKLDLVARGNGIPSKRAPKKSRGKSGTRSPPAKKTRLGHTQTLQGQSN